MKATWAQRMIVHILVPTAFAIGPGGGLGPRSGLALAGSRCRSRRRQRGPGCA